MTKSVVPALALCAFVAAGSVPTLLACGGGGKPAATPSPQASDSAATEDTSPLTASSSAPAATTPDTSPLAQVLLTDNGQISKLFDAASSAPAATMKPDGATGGDALSKGVRDAAKKLTAGMQPDGPMAMGSLKEKQHLQAEITLAPGKCYAIVGYSKKVKDLDLYLFLPPGILSAQDLTDDSKPIIGGPPQPMCPLSSTPVTYKLDIFADAGSGEVAVQLYSKGK
jgi:hypothetical protein